MEIRRQSDIEPRAVSVRTLFLNPYQGSYRFDVGMSCDQLVNTLKSSCAPPMSGDFLMRRKPFYGSVAADSFKLNWLQKNVRNSWAPVAVGRLMPMGNRTRVDISFRLHPVVMVFMWLWMIGTIVMISVLLTSAKAISPENYMLFGFPVFGAGLTFVGAMIGRGDQRSILRYFSELPDTQYLEQATKFIE